MMWIYMILVYHAEVLWLVLLSLSPSRISKSFKRSSYFFFPETIASKYTGKIFFFMIGIRTICTLLRKSVSGLVFIFTQLGESFS